MYLSLKSQSEAAIAKNKTYKLQLAQMSNVLELLTSNLTALGSDYDLLRKELSRVQSDYDTLKASSTRVSAAYSELAEKYNGLASVIDRPVKYRKVPEVSELKTWLTEDTTDDLAYNEDFNCFDFSLSLSIRARSNGWKIGAIFVSGYNNITLQKYSHPSMY